MSMTKKEKAAFDAAIKESQLLAALRFTQPVERDVKPPSEWKCEYSEGWDFNAHSARVWQGWSTTVSHGTGPAPKKGDRHYNGSQNARSMFSSEVLALRAMRYEMEQKFAEQLRQVDDRIKAVTAVEPTP